MKAELIAKDQKGFLLQCLDCLFVVDFIYLLFAWFVVAVVVVGVEKLRFNYRCMHVVSG